VSVSAALYCLLVAALLSLCDCFVSEFDAQPFSCHFVATLQPIFA